MTTSLPGLKRFALPVLASIGALTMLSGSWACGGDYSGKVESISIGTTISEVNSLILIAQEQGYFTGNGLNVTNKIYPSGVAALDGMFNHEVDIATGSEFAFAGQVLAGKDVRAMSVISRSSGEYLVARVDRGINTLADIKGKTIGVPLGSRPEFALDRFLLFQRIGRSEVTLVNVPVNRSADALVNGEVDAVALWQPYIDNIKKRMGDTVVIWDVQEDQPSYTLITSTKEWTDKNPALVVRLLKSLLQAEDYVIANPGEARVLVQQKLNYNSAYFNSVWHDYRFSVTLSQALVVALEDQARWIISNNLASEKQTPDFVKFIYIDGLKAVKPEAVNIIR